MPGGISSIPLVPNASVSAIVAERGEVTLVFNSGPGTVLIGHNRVIQAGDTDSVPMIPNQFIVSDGSHIIYATLPSGSATIYKLTGVVFTGQI